MRKVLPDWPGNVLRFHHIVLTWEHNLGEDTYGNKVWVGVRVGVGVIGLDFGVIELGFSLRLGLKFGLGLGLGFWVIGLGLELGLEFGLGLGLGYRV